MVSIRRRKLLGLYSGHSSSFLALLPKFSENGYTPETRMQSPKPDSVPPMPSNDVDEAKEVIKKSSLIKDPGSSNVSAFTESKEQQTQQFPEVKRRKRHRRKHFENQEPCVMRGVYFKNMKWQAAIKVDKKQIHLGTVGSQEEAARLYDRAAFMCGREPNFELSEEEKQELGKFNWEEFLAITRSAITHKKHHRRRTGAGLRRKTEPSMLKIDWESEQGGNGLSGSEDANAAEADTSES